MTPQKMKLHHSLFLAAAICGFGIEPLSYPCEMWLGVPPGPKEDGTKKKFTPFSTLQCSHQPVDTLRYISQPIMSRTCRLGSTYAQAPG